MSVEWLMFLPMQLELPLLQAVDWDEAARLMGFTIATLKQMGVYNIIVGTLIISVSLAVTTGVISVMRGR